MERQLILVTGPARSGKSEWAEKRATASGKSVIYIATAQLDPEDTEWQNRIELHRERRPPEWQTLEVPFDLPAVIQSAEASSCLLVDSLGTWLANILEQDEEQWQQTRLTLRHCLERTQADVILVAEETGWGVVPAYPIGRQFRDRLGELVRLVAGVANAVYLVTAGHALNLTLIAEKLPTPLNQPAKP